MATAEQVKNKIQGLIDDINEITDGSATDLTSAVDSIVVVSEATPSISVASNGVITATSTQSKGYVKGATKTKTENLTTKAATTVTPTTSTQTVVGTGVYTTGDIKVGPIPNQKSESDVTVSGASVTTPAGYYSEAVTKSVGNVNGSIGGSASSGKATAAITNVDSIATVASPSGTAGTDYFRVKATATGTAGSYTPKYTVSTAGYIGSTVTGTAQSVSVTSDSTGKTINIPKAKFEASGKSIKTTSSGGGYIPANTTVGTVSDSYIIPSGTKTITSAGTHDVKAYASASVGSGSATTPATTITANPSLSTTYTSGSGYKMSVSATKSVTPTVSAGYVSSGTAGTVTVSGSAYVPQSSTGNATTSTTDTATKTIGYGQQTTIGAGYYPTARIVRNSVSAGKATTPSTTITKNPTITVNSSGVISASVSGTQSVTPTVSVGYVSSGTAGTITVNGSATKKATDLDSNLVASNIKKGASIFGVSGTYEGLSLNTYTVSVQSLDDNATVYYTAGDGRQYTKTITASAQNIYVAENSTLRVVGPSGCFLELGDSSVGALISQDNIFCLYLPQASSRPTQTITLSSQDCVLDFDTSLACGDVTVTYFKDNVSTTIVIPEESELSIEVDCNTELTMSCPSGLWFTSSPWGDMTGYDSPFIFTTPAESGTYSVVFDNT